MKSRQRTSSFFLPLDRTQRTPEPMTVEIDGHLVPKYVAEFWTPKQRQASSLHEISYRACFKAQLPRFFIEWLTKENDVVYDPFSGRGTTVLEAGLHGRRIIANDINPLSEILCKPRFFIPDPEELKERLYAIRIHGNAKANIDLSMFYHRRTEAEIVSLRNYLRRRKKSGKEDHLDRWIRMIATNRLTGHSKGFFSVYTLPPNQAVSPESQTKINRKLRQKPEYRDTREIILRKSKSLLRSITPSQAENLRRIGHDARFLTTEAAATMIIPPGFAQLTVTSPPFLDVVDYSQDNWLRCWFNHIDMRMVTQTMTMAKGVDDWSSVMGSVFRELHRITKSVGWVAFEVGEVRKKSVRLDELVVPLGVAAGFRCEGIIVNAQQFTKTSNIWGIRNNEHGTNTNRIVLFHKE